MIIVLKPGLDAATEAALCQRYGGVLTSIDASRVLLTGNDVSAPLPEDLGYIERTVMNGTDIQLAARQYRSEPRISTAGNVLIGEPNSTVVMGGPCAAESEEQVMQTAEFLSGLGVKVFRAGAFKSRTSPYSFQGLATKGLELLAKVRERYGMAIITEVRDSGHTSEVIEATDIIQVGAKAMYDHSILKACARANKPVLLKRHFGATIQEWVQAAEFILSGGNAQVMLCERGIRTFESKTRFTLDLGGVEWLKAHTNLPVVADPSHAMGHAYGVAGLARAAMGQGVSGLLIEVHPHPSRARSDASQQMDFDAFRQLYSSLQNLATATGYRII